MDTSDFDIQAKQHLTTYKKFLNLSKYFIILTVITLVLMAIFLL